MTETDQAHPGSNSLLKIEGLVVRYGGTRAVRDLSLRVEAGESVAVIGPNGAGKTTTLKAICGTVKADSGDVILDGISILGKPPESIVSLGLVMVPEGRRIFGSLTVAENLRLGTAARLPGNAVQQDLEKELERFPVLRRYFKTPAGRLSGGEQQQLAIARALVARPRLLLLDEPSLGLAPMMVDLVFETLAELREEDITILLVEQNATAAVEFAHRSYVIRSGQVAASGTAEQLGDPARLANLYLGEQ